MPSAGEKQSAKAPPPVPDLGPLVSYGFATPDALNIPLGSPTLGQKSTGGEVVRTHPSGVRGTPENHPASPASRKLTPAQRKVMAREREKQGLALRRAGATYDQIAVTLKVTTKSATRIVARALKRLESQAEVNGKYLIALEENRLDTMFLTIWQILTSKTSSTEEQIEANRELLAIMNRRAKYRNLDYPDLEPAPGKREQAEAALVPSIKGATVEQLKAFREQFAQIKAQADAAKELSRKSKAIDRKIEIGEGEDFDPRSPAALAELTVGNTEIVQPPAAAATESLLQPITAQAPSLHSAQSPEFVMATTSLGDVLQ